MATEAELIAQIADLEEIRASGADRFSAKGESTEFRSLKELDALLATLRGELDQAQNGTRRRSKLLRARTSRSL